MLFVTGKLDRETQEVYYLQLIAKDGGDPILSSALDIQISIKDVNDNSPIFSQTEYSVTMNENTTVGEVIKHVSAKDIDEGSNGDIFYRISTHQDVEIRRYFSMDEVTGEITLRQQLNSGHVTLIVEASDKGTPPKFSQALVEVDIHDTINNPPSITINILNGTNSAKVSESVRIDFPVAHIKISDPDTGANSMVTCYCQTDGFTLQALDEMEYKVVVAKQLDYEMTKNYVVAIYCRDGGSPMMNSMKEFTVDVLDANDNDPEFLQVETVINIAENNVIGDTVIQLAATDLDSGVNGKLMYFTGTQSSINFTVQHDIPIVRANIRFDREDMVRYVFNIFAVDGGVPARTATATVTVNILDINDERPAFWQQAYQFDISENLPIGTGVGNVSAFDLDTGDGGKFSLHLAPFLSTDSVPFTILQNGTIITTQTLDREVVTDYVFKAIAVDHGRNPLSGMSQITVTVSDQNDNDPYFIFPNDVNYSATVYVTSKANTVQAQVQARDSDSDIYSKIFYSALDMNSSGLFRINNETGEVLITKDITPKMLGTYHLSLRISNSEPNSKSTTHKLLLIVALLAHDGSLIQPGGQYTMIVIVLVCATMFIAAAVLLALCYLRKRDNDRQLKQVYDQDNISGSTYGLQNPVTEVDSVASTVDKSSMQRDKIYKEKKADLDVSTSTMKGHIIQTGKQISSKSVPLYNAASAPIVADKEYQRQNQLMSFRLHQALQRLNSETGTHDHSKIMDANAKVLEWRDAQRRTDDFHSTSSGEVTTGDSGHGSDEDSHNISTDPRTSIPTNIPKIRLGIGAFKTRTDLSSVPPRSLVSPIKGHKFLPKGRNVPVLYTTGFNLPSIKDHVLPSSGYQGYDSQISPRSDDNDDTTTSGSYSITVDDIKSDLTDFSYHPVQDVYV